MRRLNRWRNQEILDYSTGIAEARKRALQRLNEQALQLDAAGVVGIAIGAALTAAASQRSTKASIWPAGR